MAAGTTIKPRRASLKLRISAAQRNLIDGALMVVSPEAYEGFMKRLDRPAQPNERLRRAMKAKAPWKPA